MAFVAAASAYYNNSSKKSSGESRSQTDREGSAGTSLAGTNITRRFDDKSKVILDSFLRQQSDAVQREG